LDKDFIEPKYKRNKQITEYYTSSPVSTGAGGSSWTKYDVQHY